MLAASHPLNILVVEDTESDFVLFCEYLKLSKLSTNNIYRAELLGDALQLIHNLQPDLIFLDLSLPDSNGLHSFERMNSEARHIPIVVLSGLLDRQVALHTISLGAQDYLMKDELDEKVLIKTIQYSIERKKILQKVVENFERYNTLIKATSDTIWDWDLRTNDVLWNEGISTVFGFASTAVQNAIEWHHQNIHPDDRERILQTINDCMREGRDHWQEEYRYKSVNGVYKFVYDRGYILKTEHNIPYRILGAMMDITERKKMQEERMRNQIETQKIITQVTIQTQEQERREIGRELHDNINQILATAKLCVDMALHEEDHRKELLSKSYENITKAINEIRVLSKTLVPPSLGDIGLKEALLELIENLTLSTELNIRIKANDHHIEEMSNNKKLIMYRIVQEQLNNILKHSSATEALIELKTIRNWVHLNIKDNGVGFDTRKKNRGIGLNNIISRVEMQDGKMEIISEPGKGCLLKIEIPE